MAPPNGLVKKDSLMGQDHDEIPDHSSFPLEPTGINGSDLFMGLIE